MDIIRFFSEAVSREASDIFIIAGKPASFKVHGEIREYGDLLHAEETYALIHEIYRHADRDMSLLNDTGDDDFSFSINAIGRFRVNAYKQRGSLAAVLRLVLFELPDHETLGIPKEVIELHKKTKGLVLVTGPAGSGKSTTLACIIDKINHNRNSHIITLEDASRLTASEKNRMISIEPSLIDLDLILFIIPNLGSFRFPGYDVVFGIGVSLQAGRDH